jgi:hypothetical protein
MAFLLTGQGFCPLCLATRQIFVAKGGAVKTALQGAEIGHLGYRFTWSPSVMEPIQDIVIINL